MLSWAFEGLAGGLSRPLGASRGPVGGLLGTSWAPGGHFGRGARNVSPRARRPRGEHIVAPTANILLRCSLPCAAIKIN
eukprot:659441-Pyramimonas_sp.AAC.1